MTERREHFFWIVGPRRRARLRLRGSFFVVGRLEPFPIFLDDPTISREHVAVVATDDGVRVRDLGSRNGVLLNGKRLDRYAEVGITPGDVLRVGNTELRLLLEGEDPTAVTTPDDPSDEHAIDDTGHTRAIKLGTPPPATSVPASPSEIAEEEEEDEAEGDATSELDVPSLPPAPPADGKVADPGDAPTKREEEPLLE